MLAPGDREPSEAPGFAVSRLSWDEATGQVVTIGEVPPPWEERWGTSPAETTGAQPGGTSQAIDPPRATAVDSWRDDDPAKPAGTDPAVAPQLNEPEPIPDEPAPVQPVNSPSSPEAE